ncbi:MAG TPA: aspartate-semialdehyde dehydrogenase [Actinomycetota bacterium]|nr:aspartate-semialdehyde dehydrogenase [Actinomycetota bacterium]
MSGDGLRVAVVGATGAVGTEMLRILEERRFPVGELVAFSSARSAGRSVRFRGDDVTLRELTPEALVGVDLSLSAAGASVAQGFVREAATAGTVCIDKSSAFRMEPDVPLVVPEVNPRALAGDPRIVAVPNCTTIVAMMALAPLHRAAGLRSLVVSSYQAVSGAGRDGTRELAEQIEKLQGQVEELGHPDPGALPTGDVFGKTMAFNVLPKIDAFVEDGSTGEEVKTVRESRKILDLPELDVAATCVRVPVPVGHSVSLLARFSRSIDPNEARALLRDSPGVDVRDDPANGVYPSPLEAAGRDDVLVGRIRRAGDHDDTLLLFACGDNLRKGAALNGIQIAERLFDV